MNPDWYRKGQPKSTESNPVNNEALTTSEQTEGKKQLCKEIGRALAKVGDDLDNVFGYKPLVVNSVIVILEQARQRLENN